MITVGKIWQGKKLPEEHGPTNSWRTMLCMAKQFDISLFLFSPADVDVENKTINGLFPERNRQVRRRVGIPAIIDNSAGVANSKSTREIASVLRHLNLSVISEDFRRYARRRVPLIRRYQRVPPTKQIGEKTVDY
jgi:hypothetical protein